MLSAIYLSTHVPAFPLFLCLKHLLCGSRDDLIIWEPVSHCSVANKVCNLAESIEDSIISLFLTPTPSPGFLSTFPVNNWKENPMTSRRSGCHGNEMLRGFHCDGQSAYCQGWRSESREKLLSNCQRRAPQNNRALHVVCLAFHLPSKSL